MAATNEFRDSLKQREFCQKKKTGTEAKKLKSY